MRSCSAWNAFFICQHKLVSKYKLGRRYYEFGKMLEDLKKGIENQLEEFQAKMLHEILMLVASLGCLAQHPYELVVRSWTLRYVHEWSCLTIDANIKLIVWTLKSERRWEKYENWEKWFKNTEIHIFSISSATMLEISEQRNTEHSSWWRCFWWRLQNLNNSSDIIGKL